MFLTVIISLVCVYLGYVIACRHFLPRVNELIPTYPGKLSIIGHSYMCRKKTFVQNVVIGFGEFALKVGGVAKTFMGPLPVYVVADPEDAATVLNKCLKKMFVYRFVEMALGNTLVAADVSVWKRNRRILDPCFKQQILDEFLQLFTARAGRFIEMLAEDVGKGEVDLTNKITNAIVETACLTTLGIELDGIDVEGNESLAAVKETMEIILTRINKPWLLFDFIFNMSNYKIKLTKAVATASKLVHEMVELRKTEHLQRLKNKEVIDQEGGKFQSILEIFIANTVTETSSIFTDHEIKDIIGNVLGAAFDTTISEELFTFACIGSYPEVQEKIYKEVIQVLGEEGGVSKQNISQLVYLEAAIKESLRLYPSAPMVAREATADTQLRNVIIPAGSSVLVNLRSINRNTEYWGLDAEEFKPERWLSSDTAPRHRAAFATFSPGLRGCIGRSYAMMYLKATMAQVLRRFKLAADHTKITLSCDILMKPESGHFVRIEERRSNQ